MEIEKLRLHLERYMPYRTRKESGNTNTFLGRGKRDSTKKHNLPTPFGYQVYPILMLGSLNFLDQPTNEPVRTFPVLYSF